MNRKARSHNRVKRDRDKVCSVSMYAYIYKPLTYYTGLFRLAETVEQSTFTSTETKEELQARLKRKAEDDLEEDAERRHKQSLGRQIRPKPTTSRRYHVVTEDDDKKDVFIDVEQSKNESVSHSDKKDASFDPYDEDSEQMQEFRKLVEDYLKSA